MGREKIPKKPLFATFPSESKPAELLFQKDGESYTTNPLQETLHLEKHGEKTHLEAGDGLGGVQ